jgi:SagB-type dehydrogenase family enzyme
MKLPAPRYESGTSVEKALQERRSVRVYRNEPLTLDQVAQLLWSAQGITHPDGLRTSPSAGALYPLEAYVVAGNVRGLPPGLYHYRPAAHDLERRSENDLRVALCRAASQQEAVRDAGGVLILTVVHERITGKYGERGERYADFEIGHAAQNVLLQAVALGLGAVLVGAFDDASVQKLLDLPEAEHPRYLIPIGSRWARVIVYKKGIDFGLLMSYISN